VTDSGGSARFDPYRALKALDRHRVTYIIIGAFARVIHGTEELTRGLDIVPSTRGENLRRLARALDELNARRDDGAPLTLEQDLAREPLLELATDAGELKIIPEPVGTRGYDDLRRAAAREPLGQGVRPSVAAPGDLARMLSALGRQDDVPSLRMLQFERELRRGRSLER
jgi:hypothetical protein